MAPKRKSDADYTSSNKRQHRTDQPSQNKIYGQYGAFPGLDGSASDDGSVDVQTLPEDPIAYLRGVRSQASRIPTLLTTSAPHQRDDKVIYGRDAIIAAPPTAFIGPARPPPAKDVQAQAGATEDAVDVEDEDDDDRAEAYLNGDYADSDYYSDEDTTPALVPAQEGYHQRLISEYYNVQDALSQPLPPGIAAKQNPLKRMTKSQWRSYVKRVNPSPAVLAQLDSQQIFTALQSFTVDMRWRDWMGRRNQGVHYSAWLWGLLARLDAETLNYEDMGRVRDLGKSVLRMLEKTPSRPNKPRNPDENMETGKRKVNKSKDGAPVLTEYENITKWKSALDAMHEVELELDIIVADAIEKVEEDCDVRVVAQVIRWVHANDVMRRLIDKVRAAGGDPKELDDSDSEAFAETIRTAHEIVEGPVTESRGESDDREEEGEATVADDEWARNVRRGYATCDMVLTIVGEVFGQRDLLEQQKHGRSVCWDQ